MRFRLLVSRLLIFSLRSQTARLSRQYDRLHQRIDRASAAPILRERKRIKEAFAELWDRTLTLESELAVIGSAALPLDKETFLSRATVLQHDFATFKQKHARVENEVSIFCECEVEPLSDYVQLLRETGAALIHRANYLRLWLTGETNAPVLEVLLYFVVPIAHLELVAGDLEEEYRTIQIPRRGPKAAQWWYTKHVIKTISWYAIRATKRAQVVVAAVRLLRLLLRWCGF